ncbi:MAG: hypothetical protein AAF366_12480 [Pseudomonadota bacterium]
MFRPILAATLSLALAFPAAHPAMADDAEDVAKVLGGLAALYILSQAINTQSDRRAEPVRRVESVRRAPVFTPTIRQRQQGNLHWNGRYWEQRPTIRQLQEGRLRREGHDWVQRPTIRQQHRHRQDLRRDVRILPDSCYREFDTRRGVVAGYGARCMQNRVARPGILPPQCIRQVRTDRDGTRNLYGPRCLRQQGWSPRTARR